MTEKTETKSKKAPAKAAAKAPAKAAKKASGKGLRVTQLRSAAGRYANQRATLIGLGLNKINRSNVVEDTPAIRGMIRAVQHLVKVEDAA